MVATHPAIAATYLLINDPNGARSDRDDLLIRLSDPTGTLPPFGSSATAPLFGG